MKKKTLVCKSKSPEKKIKTFSRRVIHRINHRMSVIQNHFYAFFDVFEAAVFKAEHDFDPI